MRMLDAQVDRSRAARRAERPVRRTMKPARRMRIADAQADQKRGRAHAALADVQASHTRRVRLRCAHIVRKRCKTAACAPSKYARRGGAAAMLNGNSSKASNPLESLSRPDVLWTGMWVR